MQRECYTCEFKKEVPGNCHIACTNPDKGMTGNAHGVKMGWFIYPHCFDPVWKTKKCSNYKSRVSLAISGAVKAKTKAQNGQRK